VSHPCEIAHRPEDTSRAANQPRYFPSSSQPLRDPGWRNLSHEQDSVILRHASEGQKNPQKQAACLARHLQCMAFEAIDVIAASSHWWRNRWQQTGTLK
jgi:hypothetical protein